MNPFNDFDNLDWSLMPYENYGLKGHIIHLNKPHWMLSNYESEIFGGIVKFLGQL